MDRCRLVSRVYWIETMQIYCYRILSVKLFTKQSVGGGEVGFVDIVFFNIIITTK